MPPMSIRGNFYFVGKQSSNPFYLPMLALSKTPGGGKAAITGDFVLLGTEVNPIVKSLRQHGIEVTALHSHMIDDSPHLLFMHFWANDDAQRLAQGLRAALDLANVKRGS
jgi:uncharacterized protein DUF1259